jgi:hypothetical protein
MMSDNKKRFLGLLAFLAVAAVLLLIAFMPTNGPRWEAASNRTAKLKLEATTRKVTRQVLRGKPIPGNAWEEYNIALNASWPAAAGTGTIFYQFASGQPGVDRDLVKQMVAQQMPLLDHLRLGAQRADGQYPYKWETEDEIPSLLRTRQLSNLAVAQARILTDSGKPQEAADLLLDVIVFGKDLTTNGPLLSNLIGVAVYQIALEQIRHLLSSGKLTQAQLVDLAGRLEIADREFPAPSSTVANTTLSLGMNVFRGSTAGMDGGLGQRLRDGGWRYAMFPQTTLLDAFEENDAFVERIKKVDQSNFAAAQKELSAVAIEAVASSNAMVRDTVPGMVRSIQAHLEALAKLRLVRAETLFRATGRMPTIADPFGASLLSKEEAGGLKIWSIGYDGINDNGVGDWERGQPDIVSEILK